MVSQAYTSEQAQDYEEADEHALPAQEKEIWLREMATLAPAADARILDFGAGTGALLGVLKKHGLFVRGLEPSRAMIERGLMLHPDLSAEDFILGTAGDAPLADGSIDLVVSRQVLCHLDRPDAVFACFHRWLRPSGTLLLVDGYWKSFSVEARRRYPLAGVTSPATVADHVAAAGFQILRAEAWIELNTARRFIFPASAPRFLVTSKKS